jgi:tetratricopeptide (TPR) repeat protein
VRPADGDDWTLAYCQAELYAEFMLQQYGDDALAKMLTAYAENLNTRQALRQCFGAEQEDFENAYREYLDQVIAAAGPLDSGLSLDLAELQKAAKEDPRNAGPLARLAYAHLQRKSNPQARQWALAAQKVDPKNQLAAYVLARLQLSIGDAEKAMALLDDAVSHDAPQENALGLLAGLKLQAKDYAAAERLYQLGLEKFGDDEQWLKALARIHLLTQDDEKLAETLAKLAELDGDDVVIRKKLAVMALSEKDYAAAGKWANQALLIDVMDAEVHAAAGQAAAGLENYPDAIAAYEIAVRIDPKQLAWRFALADAQVQAGQRDQARETLEKLLEIDPKFPWADVLLESLRQPSK